MHYRARYVRSILALGGVMSMGLAGIGRAEDAQTGPASDMAPVVTANPARPLTLAEAAKEALTWHPSITEAAGVLSARGEEINAARAGYLPTVSTGLGSGYDSRVSGTWRPRPQIGASQMLYDFGKVSSDVAAARAGTRGGRAELLLAVDTLIRESAYAVIELQRATALHAVALDQASRIEQISALVGQRSKMGAATQSDALQAEARVEAASATLTQIEASKRRWTSNLAYLLNRDTPPAAVAPDVPDWLMRSCSRPMPEWNTVPSVMVADALVDRADAAVRRSRADRYPTVSLGGDASSDIASPFGQRSIYNFGLRVSSNVFSGGITKARLRGAGYERDAAEASARRARLDTSQGMAEAQQQIDSLTRVIDTLVSRQGNMRETNRLYRIQYLEMGTRTLVDLLNAEQELQQVRFEAINTTQDVRRLQVDCLFLSGRMRDAFGFSGTTLRGVTL
ncbi:TolC family protein [Sphingomonas sp. ZB1N12]|uniref:TolC family protein n=1 Tax=Sphingomonas arabinosi TaxID=3096160 RepID=UPI002FCC17C3